MQLTDAGIETVLVFEEGIDLPHFAAFPLVDTAAGRPRCDVTIGHFSSSRAIAAPASYSRRRPGVQIRTGAT